MPEGDTIFRAATTLRKWIQGREVTAARTKVLGLHLERVVGTTIEVVEPRAKHLLIRFSNSLTLHTHMKMVGSWHVYRAGERWQKPPWQAKVELQCDDHVAVCFNAPVVELITPNDERAHISLQGLGPDVLGPGDFDYDEVLRRAAKEPEELTMGELLLKQQVVSGIGNIYRCESLFMERINPWTPRIEIDDTKMRDLLNVAIRLMKVNAGPAGNRGRDFETGGPNRPWVYKRNGRPCLVCRTNIETALIGSQPRSVFWCPKCQARRI
jgi:endonuclease VIII